MLDQGKIGLCLARTKTEDLAAASNTDSYIHVLPNTIMHFPKGEKIFSQGKNIVHPNCSSALYSICNREHYTYLCEGEGGGGRDSPSSVEEGKCDPKCKELVEPFEVHYRCCVCGISIVSHKLTNLAPISSITPPLLAEYLYTLVRKYKCSYTYLHCHHWDFVHTLFLQTAR